MRLGVVTTGFGAQAAACAGVLRALEERGMTAHSVCGMGSGAWVAALFALGRRSDRMQAAIAQAQSSSGRLLAPTASARSILTRGAPALSDGKRLEHLLLSQTGHRVLSLCESPAVFPCRLARGGGRVVFSTRPFDIQEGTALSMQATVSFAARAAMALPPLLAPLEYMGTPLLGETDAAFACRLLVQLGAQRVMIIAVHPSPMRKPDALDLAGAAAMCGLQEAAKEAHAGLLQVRMPADAGALNVERAMECEQAGYLAAQEQLDALLEQMGMARCRVLPFERKIMAHRP